MPIHGRGVYFPPFAEKEEKQALANWEVLRQRLFSSQPSFSPSSFQRGLSAMQAFHSCSLPFIYLFLFFPQFFKAKFNQRLVFNAGYIKLAGAAGPQPPTRHPHKKLVQLENRLV